MGGLCSRCGRLFGTTKDAPAVTFQPAANRSCTDILFLIAFIASFGGMLAIILTATGRDSTPERIYHGVNWMGETCGQGTQHDRPYNAWIAMPGPVSLAPANNNAPSNDCTDCFYIKTCLADCNHTSSRTYAPEMIDVYPSEDYGYFCVPSVGTLLDVQGGVDVKVEFTYSGDFDTAAQNAGRAMGDLYTTWPLILGSAAVALLFAFLYNKLSETIAGVLVTFTLIVMITGGVLASYALIKAGRDAREKDQASDTAKAMYAVGIILAIATAIFTVVVIALRQRIRIAIEIVKEANRCVADIWSLIFFPLVPLLMGLGYLAFWIVVTVYIFAVWETSPREFPDYITSSQHFVDSAAGGPFVKNATSGNYDYTYYTWDTGMQKSFVYVFFHLLWSAQFVIYFAYMVMAGAIANWYFAPRDAKEQRIVGKNPGELSHTPVADSCARTCRFHIGTVALAAFIIATVQFIRACVKYVEKKMVAANGGVQSTLQRAVFCLIHCCLACLQCCLDKINKNALVWTSVWGDSFGTAACSSFKLLWGNLARTGAMSVISTFLMFIGKVTIAIATCGFGGIFIHAHYDSKVSSPVLPMVVIFIIGYIVGALFMSIFEVAMDTIFLCFLIDEKLHANAGTMCASKGLRALVENDEIKRENAAYAQQEHNVQERRMKQLGLSDEHSHNTGANHTGVTMASAPATNTGFAAGTGPTQLHPGH